MSGTKFLLNPRGQKEEVQIQSRLIFKLETHKMLKNKIKKKTQVVLCLL